ncbi:MAG TPA: DUF2135 domain-containing protein [Myxococcota bacterium]
MQAIILVAALLTAQPGGEAKEDDVGVPIGTGRTKATVTISAPTGGWTVDRMMLVAGTVSDPTINPVLLSINGDRYLLHTNGGRFSRKFPASAGKNVVTVIARNKGGTTTKQVTTYAQTPPVPLRAVLTSDTDGVYTDLHVYEPTDESLKEGLVDAAKMAHVYWANTESPSGGTFFLNEQDGNFDQPGYGPYLYIHRAPPRGLYMVTANYWPSGDKAHTVGTLNLTVYEGTPNEVRRTVKVPLATPGTTRVLAWVLLNDAGGASVHVPGVDMPVSLLGKKSPWPKNLEAATEAMNTTGNAGGGEE